MIRGEVEGALVPEPISFNMILGGINNPPPVDVGLVVVEFMVFSRWRVAGRVGKSRVVGLGGIVDE